MCRMFLPLLVLAFAPTLVHAQSLAPPPHTEAAAAAANVQRAKDYSSALRSNPSFRQQRIEKECGPIESPDLKALCIQSFGPALGSR